MPGIPDDPFWFQTATTVSSATNPPIVKPNVGELRDSQRLWWNSEGRIDFLTKAWNEGRLSANQIAVNLSDKGRHRVTRSMVIGKAYRLGLSGRKARAHPLHAEGDAIPRKPREKKPPKPTLERERPSLPKVENVPLEGVPPVELVDLERCHCRYPVGVSEDTGLMLYCGAQRYDEYSYCAHHAAKCYNFSAMRRQ